MHVYTKTGKLLLITKYFIQETTIKQHINNTTNSP